MESMSVEDLGPAVHYILSRCEEFKNKTLSISAEKLTLHEYAKTLSKAMGKKIKYQPMTEEEYGKQTGDEKNMLQMFRFMKNFPLKRVSTDLFLLFALVSPSSHCIFGVIF